MTCGSQHLFKISDMGFVGSLKFKWPSKLLPRGSRDIESNSRETSNSLDRRTMRPFLGASSHLGERHPKLPNQNPSRENGVDATAETLHNTNTNGLETTDSEYPPSSSRTIQSSSPNQPIHPIDFVKLEQQHINFTALETLASAYRNGSPCRCLQETEAGGCNMIFFIEFLDGTCWVARLPSRTNALRPLEDPRSQEAMASMITTIEFLNEHSTLPVPEIYGYDVTCDNPLHRPYVFMSKLPGVLISSLLDDAFETRQNIMLNIVKQWGAYVIELASLRFTAIGSLQRNEDDEYKVEQLITPYNLGLDNSLDQGVHRGPFISVIDYLLSLSAVKRVLDDPHKPSFGGHLRMSLVESLLSYFVDHRFIQGPFVLSHIDLNIHNILIDPETGNITGIIDWDYAAILPLQSHLVLCEIFNTEFLPASEFEKRSPDEYAVNLQFSKRFRKAYEDSICAAALKLGLDYPIEDILDTSLMYGLFEKSLSYMPNEKYLPALWNHVYGGGIEEQERIRNKMRNSDWAAVMAEKWNVDVKRMEEEREREEDSENPSGKKTQQDEAKLSFAISWWKSGKQKWIQRVRAQSRMVIERRRNRIKNERNGGKVIVVKSEVIIRRTLWRKLIYFCFG